MLAFNQQHQAFLKGEVSTLLATAWQAGSTAHAVAASGSGFVIRAALRTNI
jgi:hypothetical protein